MTNRFQLQLRASLLAGVAASVGVASAQAQEADNQPDRVVVTGTIVGSQAAGIEYKREADNVVDVISSDAIGNFPDQNSAAALARLPAVAVQRDQGQERYLQVRGAPNRWTSVSVDGITIIGADEVGSSRAFRFDAVPAVTLSSLEVNKTLTPDLSAEAISAQVNLRTASPFDHTGLQFQINGGYGEMDLGGGPQEEYGGRVSWSGDRFGVIAAASHYSREQKTDNREFGYTGDNLVPDEFDFRSYTVTRESNAGMLGVEFRPAHGHRLFAKTLYTEFNDEEQRNQYVFDLAGSFGDPALQTPTGGSVTGASVQGSFNLGDYLNSNWVNTIGGDHELGEWDAEWRLNYTEVDNTTSIPLTLHIQTDPTTFVSFDYDRTDPNLPTLDLYETNLGATGFSRGAPLAALDQGAFGLVLGLFFDTSLLVESTTLKGDLSRTFDLGGRDVDVAFGLQYDDRDLTGATFGGSLGAPVPLPNITPADYVTNDLWPSGFPRGFGINWLDVRAMNPDVHAGFAAAEQAGMFDPDATVSPDAKYGIEEKLLAGYGKAAFNVGPAEIVAGLRIEQMDQSISGSLVTADGVTPITRDNDNTDVFPSINAKFDVGPDTVFRLGATTGIARASFGSVRPGASISDVNQTVSGGNPDLKPEKTVGFDASLEHYIGASGIASAAAFYRDVDDVLFTGTTLVGDDRFNTAGIDRSDYDYTSTLNGGEGSLLGLELAYQQQFEFLPGFWRGLGVQGNLALLDGEFKLADGTKAPLPGTSETIVNATLFYELYGLSTRLSYQWRDDWVDTLSIAGFSDQFRKDYANLDLSIRYAISDQFTVFADFNNLTDEKYIAYLGDESRPTEVEQIGRRYLAGFRFSY